MNLTITEWIFIGVVLSAGSITGIAIRYNDIKNNTVRHSCSDSSKKLEAQKPPNREMNDLKHIGDTNNMIS